MDALPLSDLIDEGVLWLINRAVFHPRGLAMYLYVDDDGEVTGWGIHGDGTEPWQTTVATDDEKFLAVEALLERARSENRRSG